MIEVRLPHSVLGALVLGPLLALALLRTHQGMPFPLECPPCATHFIRGIVAFVARPRENRNSQQKQVYSPHDVAVQLGISTAALRRLAQAYERTFGELARDSRFGRVWPQS
jgi:hypothetical protein